MRTIGMATKLHLLICPQLHRLLEFLSNLHQRLPSRAIPSLVLPHRPRPQPDPEECLPDIDDHAHDFVVVVFFEGFAYGG
jgi:hypothetical protein